MGPSLVAFAEEVDEEDWGMDDCKDCEDCGFGWDGVYEGHEEMRWPGKRQLKHTFPSFRAVSLRLRRPSDREFSPSDVSISD